MTQTLNFTLQPRLDPPLRAIEASTDLDLSELIAIVDNALDGTEGLTSQEIAKEIAWHPSRVDARLVSIGLQYRHAEGQWRATQFGKPLVIAQEAQGPRWSPAILSFFAEVV
jgi:hypothetical protein